MLSSLFGKKKESVSTPSRAAQQPSRVQSKPIESLISKHKSDVTTLAVLPDGRLVSGGMGDKTIRIWSERGGNLENSATINGPDDFWLQTTLPDGRIVSRAASDHRIKIWSESSAGNWENNVTLDAHMDGVYAFDLLPDGRFVSGSADKVILVWSQRSGHWASKKILTSYTYGVGHIEALLDGSFLSYGSCEHTVQVWSERSDSWINVQTLQGHTDNLSCLKVLPDGRFVSGSHDQTIRVWSKQNSSWKNINTLNGHSSWVNALVALPDGRLVSGSYDATIRIWSERSGSWSQNNVLSDEMHNVHALAVLLDGRLVSGSSDNKIRVWDIACTQPKASTSKVATHASQPFAAQKTVSTEVSISSSSSNVAAKATVTSFKQSPIVNSTPISGLHDHLDAVNVMIVLPDGRLASGSDDKTIRVWNVASGLCELTLRGHHQKISALAVLPDGRLVSGAGNESIGVWNTASGVLEAAYDGHEASVRALVALPGGRLAIGSDDNTIRFLNLKAKACELTLSKAPISSTVYELIMLANGYLASGSSDKNIRLWNTATGECVLTLEGPSSVISLKELPDGRLASGSGDGAVRIWNLRNRKCELVLSTPDYTNGIYSLTVLPDGRFATGALDDAIRIWNVQSGKCEVTLTGHTGTVSALAVLLDGRLVSGSSDHTMLTWDIGCTYPKIAPSPNAIKRSIETPFQQDFNIKSAPLATITGHNNSIEALTALPDGRLVSGNTAGMILWEKSGGTFVQRGTLLGGHEASQVATLSLAALPDGRLVSGSGDNLIRLWDVASGKYVKTFTGHTKWISALLPLPSGQLASGSPDGTVRIWNLASGQCVKTLEVPSPRAFALLGDGRLAVADSSVIGLWNIASGKCIASLYGHEGSNGWVADLLPLPDGRLASAAGDRTVRLWDVIRAQCVATFTGHTSTVFTLALLPNGRLASGAGDKTIRVWDVQSENCVAVLSGHTSSVSTLVTLPDGRLASEGGSDKTILLWDVSRAPQKPVKAKVLPRTEQSSITSSNASKVSISDPFSEFDNIFSAPTSSKATSKASTDWTSDFSTVVPPLPPAKAIIPSLADMRISSNLTTIPWHALVIQRELGRGGFGVVCEALWQGTRVAIKQLIGQLTPALLSEFKSETEVHAHLRHTNIIALYGVCIEPMKYALVMEFMANGSLFDVLKNSAELPWSLRLSLSLDMVSGLLYLHTQHIIHRDLKSLNILVDDHMRAKIADFGLAKIKLSTASMTKGGGGTPHWMAPELFDETVNSPATDVYATGIILWEIAARKLPYEGKNASQIMRTVEKGHRETMPAGTPPPFGVLISRCWAQRAEDRPSIEVVARDIREIQARLPSNASSAKASVDSGYAAFSRR